MNEKLEITVFKQKITVLFAVAFGIYFVYASSAVLARLGVAVLAMVILDPLVNFFTKYMPKKSRFLAILFTFAFLGLIVLLVIARLVPILGSQFNAAITTLNQVAFQAENTGQTLSQAIASNNPTSTINSLLPYIARAVPSITSFILSGLSSVLSGLFSFLMVFGFVLFGLIEGPRLVTAIKKPYQKSVLKTFSGPLELSTLQSQAILQEIFLSAWLPVVLLHYSR